jgi:hypothetical protein
VASAPPQALAQQPPSLQALLRRPRRWVGSPQPALPLLSPPLTTKPSGTVLGPAQHASTRRRRRLLPAPQTPASRVAAAGAAQRRAACRRRWPTPRRSLARPGPASQQHAPQLVDRRSCAPLQRGRAAAATNWAAAGARGSKHPRRRRAAPPPPPLLGPACRLCAPSAACQRWPRRRRAGLPARGPPLPRAVAVQRRAERRLLPAPARQSPSLSPRRLRAPPPRL